MGALIGKNAQAPATNATAIVLISRPPPRTRGSDWVCRLTQQRPRSTRLGEEELTLLLPGAGHRLQAWTCQVSIRLQARVSAVKPGNVQALPTWKGSQTSSDSRIPAQGAKT